MESLPPLWSTGDLGRRQGGVGVHPECCVSWSTAGPHWTHVLLHRARVVGNAQVGAHIVLFDFCIYIAL